MKLFCIYIFLFFSALCFSQTDSANTFFGVASYYAKAFEGRKCSSGEVFSNKQLTAAHKHLKFGTQVKVTNLKNDSTVIVKINDRMPSNNKRIIDLSQKAAHQLNFIHEGITKVKLEILKDSLP